MPRSIDFIHSIGATIRDQLGKIFKRTHTDDRMARLAASHRTRRLMAALMLGTSLNQPILHGCSSREQTQEQSPLPEIDDPADEEDAAVHRSPDSNSDEEVNILDLDPNVGMGATIRNIAQAMRLQPTAGNIPVVFFNTTNGWTQCGQFNMPENRANDDNWWDNARGQLDRARCGEVDIGRELPLGMPWRIEHTFPRIRQTARQPMHAHENVNRRTQIRRAFLAAARHTRLYRYLNDYSPDLAEQFVNLACDGIPALETEYGANIRRSPTGAEGIWQIEEPTLTDARDHSRNDWNTVFRNRNPSVHNVRDASQIAAFIFDDIYRYYRTKWPENHPVFRYPEALLVPLLIAGYNPGRGAAERMMTSRLQDADMQELLATGDEDRIQNEAYITASTVYFLRRTDPNYRVRSVGYVPKVFAYHALFQRDVPGEDNEVGEVDELPTIRDARSTARNNLQALRRRTERTVAITSDPRFNLANVVIPRSAADWHFVTSASSQNNAVVYPWVVAHDSFARRYQQGVPNNVQLETVIAREVAAGNLIRENANARPEIIFDPSNIAQEWRRVLRTNHISALHKVIVEVNARMYAYGQSTDTIILPIITSTMRNTSDQRRLRGHSNRSAHPMGAAIDFSCRQYAVLRRRADGSYERFVTSANISMYFRALVQASAHLARPRRLADGGTEQGDIFVRFHGPPKHFHMVVRDFGGDDEEREITPVPTTVRRPVVTARRHQPTIQRPNTSIHRRPVLQRRRPILRHGPVRHPNGQIIRRRRRR